MMSSKVVSKSESVVDAFLAKVEGQTLDVGNQRGRLIFALDATASRQPTWDTACRLQASMFREAELSRIGICRAVSTLV